MLINELEKQGSWLFRWRSFLPFLIIPLALYFFFQFIKSPPIQEKFEEYFQYLCFVFSILGATLRALTVAYVPKNTSGRNTTSQKAAFLNTTGMYSIVRHPLYLANYIVFAGFVMQLESLSFFIICTLLYIIYYERIMMAEEKFLIDKFGQDYLSWANIVPSFFPNISLWKKPALPFSGKTILRREGPGLLLICAVFFTFNFVDDILVEKQPFSDWVNKEPVWSVALALSIITYAILKILRKKTHLLDVPDRDK